MDYTTTQTGETFVIALRGDWSVKQSLIGFDPPTGKSGAQAAVRFEADDLGTWDSSLLAFVWAVQRWAEGEELRFDIESLPAEIGNLIALALNTPQQRDAAKDKATKPFLDRVGVWATGFGRGFVSAADFVGETVVSLGDLVRGRCHFRSKDFVQCLADCGPRSLGIVGLISLMIGAILAFVGAMQLKEFGAEIYVADLVGVSLAREMASMMTGILMAGQTGAAYAAQLGSMQANEEIDALTTLGIKPYNYLVMPRLLAQVLMMPLLTLYSLALGVLGGLLVCTTVLDLSATLFLQRIAESVPLYYFGMGLLKSLIFGVLIALCGCAMGMRCGRSTMAVGQATTHAVVLAIVLIVVTDCGFALITTLMGV